jgi:hypothetical protein
LKNDLSIRPIYHQLETRADLAIRDLAPRDMGDLGRVI